MAQFDLKNAIILMKDGYTGPGGAGLVNLMAGYMTGAVTMAVDGFVGAVAVGDTFTITGESGSPIHTISAHTESSMNTTSITFSPAVVGSIADDTALTMLNHSLEINVGDGNVTFTEKFPREYKRNRGILSEVRNGDQDPMEVKMDFIWTFLKAQSGDPPSPIDALKQRGNAATWVTSDGDPCKPYCIDIVITYTPVCNTEEKEITVLPQFRYEELQHDVKQGVIAVTGKCNVLQASTSRSN